MRIYSSCRELMSEMGRELNSYGQIVKPKTYQNKVIEGQDDFITKEIICKQYCLTKMPDPKYLFAYTHTREWADAELSERISGKQINPGEAWKKNPSMWEQFLVTYKDGTVFDYTYAERINAEVVDPTNRDLEVTNLQAIIGLLKNDPDTRKAVLSIYNAGEDANYYDGTHRIPCSMYYDFLIRESSRGRKQLNICYHQRSSDFIGHFGDDVYLAYMLMQYVASQIGVLPGYLYHTIDSLHSYKKDWHYLNSNIEDLI